MWEVIDSYERMTRLLPELSAVSAADVQRVAQSYLAEQNRTIGHFIPNDKP
jgi:zinc protease